MNLNSIQTNYKPQNKNFSFTANLNIRYEDIRINASRFNEHVKKTTNLTENDINMLKEKAKKIGNDSDSINIGISRDIYGDKDSKTFNVIVDYNIYDSKTVDILPQKKNLDSEFQHPFSIISEWMDRFMLSPIVKRNGAEITKINPQNGIMIEHDTGWLVDSSMATRAIRYFDSETGNLNKLIDITNGEKETIEYAKNGKVAKYTTEYESGDIKSIREEYNQDTGFKSIEVKKFRNNACGVTEYTEEGYKSTYKLYDSNGNFKGGSVWKEPNANGVQSIDYLI